MASTKMFTKNAHHGNSSSSTFFHHQQQVPPTSTPPNATIDEDMTLTHEMHVKMAKKIAQLTKVSRWSYLLLLLYANKRERESTMSSTDNIHCVVGK